MAGRSQSEPLIVTERLQWYHLPKTAGTTTDCLFELSGLPMLRRDSQKCATKHLPPAEHPEALRWLSPQRACVVNHRGLPAWLLSNHQHKRHWKGIELEFEPVQSGLFFRQRDQRWLPADWWLHRFGVTAKREVLRAEALKEDSLRLLATDDSGTPPTRA